MKKSLLFAAAALFLSSPCVLADDETYLTSLSNVDSSKNYYIVSDRSALLADADGTVVSTETFVTDPTDDQKKFAFITLDNENYYIYSVSAKKFLTSTTTSMSLTNGSKTCDPQLSTTSADAIQFNDATSYGENRVQIQFVGKSNGYINAGDNYWDYRLIVDDYSSVDGGNAMLISVADTDFDATDAKTLLNKILNPEEDKGDSTGINEVTAAEATGAIYDLQGRRVANASNGIYIINGKKVLVK